jgi:predicted enzyme related to lactoylglutathione lyase
MAQPSNTGFFVWRDLVTPDPAAAESFYTGLFGWTVQHHDFGTGTIFRIFEIDGVPAGTIVPPLPGSTGAFWYSYIGTPDADAAAEKAASLGATVQIYPGDVEGFGRFGVIADPHGAVFAPITGDQPGPDPNADVPLGGVSWNELISPDIAASSAFYRALFDYDSYDIPSSDGTYKLLQRTENGVTTTHAGIFHAPDAHPAPAWIVYFRVGDIDIAREQAQSLGATLKTGVIDVADFGRTCWLTDPTGALIGLHQVAEE